MTKDDKQFFRGLIGGLEKKITGVELRLEERIRHNGVLIEDVKSDVIALREGQAITNQRLNILESDVRDIKETTSDYPILRETVKKHSRKLAKLA